MNNIQLILKVFFLLFPTLIWAQGGIVNNGASIKVTASTDLKINDGGVINKNNGDINNQGNLYLDLDWTQFGAVSSYIGNGWMSFEGNANQNLSSTSPITISRLRVNNSNRVILNDNVNVSNQVDLLNNGSIELGTNNLVLASGASIVNYDKNHFIITNSTGVLQQEVGATDVIFPIGNSTYNPITLNNTGVLDSFSARVEDQVWDQGTTGNLETQNIVNRTWHIEEETIGGSSATLTVQWDIAQELVGFNRAQSGIAHWNGSLWEHPAAFTAVTSVGTAFTQTRAGINTFSPFAVEDLEILLPVELLFFEAYRIDKNNVQLDWATESETDNLGFEIERMLDTETEFRKIAWIDGVENSTQVKHYTTNDLNSHHGISYYRLKQIDANGASLYSPVRAVEGHQLNGTIRIYPVPTNDVLTVDFNNWKQSDIVHLRVIDAQGRVLIHKDASIVQNSFLEMHEVKVLSAGTYFLVATSKQGLNFVRKFTKNEY